MTLAFLGMETFAFLRWPRFSYKYLNLFFILLRSLLKRGLATRCWIEIFFRVFWGDEYRDDETIDVMIFFFLGFVVLTKK